MKLLLFIFLLCNSDVLYGTNFLLTIDDGPNKHTGAILDRLIELNCPAIFFVTDAKPYCSFEMYKHVLKKMIDNGYQIGNHTKSHSYAIMTNGSFELVEREIRYVNDYFKDEFNYNIKLFRPPGGYRRKTVYDAIEYHGLENMMWTSTLWFDEYTYFNEERIEHWCIKRNRKMKYKIILVHSTKWMAKQIGLLVKTLRKHGTIVK